MPVSTNESTKPSSAVSGTGSEQTVRIAHLTDSHTTSLAGTRFRDLLGKRALGYLSWRRKRARRHTQRMLENTTRATLGHNPDAVVITGDLLHIGLADEMRQIRPWLNALANQVPVLLVPGNHDLYAADSSHHWQQELGDLPVFGARPESEEPSSADWPRTLQVGHVRVIGLSSAYPAPLTRADGKLGSAQQARLAHALKTTNSETQATLLALHHPAEPALAAERKSLLDAAPFQKLIRSHAAQIAALVHGHLHQNLSYSVGDTPCFCTASASSTALPNTAQHSMQEGTGKNHDAPASFRLLEFAGASFRSRLFEANSSSEFVERHEAHISEPKEKT